MAGDSGRGWGDAAFMVCVRRAWGLGGHEFYGGHVATREMVEG